MAKEPKTPSKQIEKQREKQLDKQIEKDLLHDKRPKEFKNEKIEKPEFKEFKDHKHEKIEKNEAKEHKDHKHEKLEKNEVKEHKDAKLEKLEKNEAKEHKDHKHEKIEHKELQKDHIPEKQHGKEKDGKELAEGDFDPGDPVFRQGLSAAGDGSAEHFIDPDQRPDLSGGALSGEEDQPTPGGG
ncbi:MAG: hypothetical protein QOI38_1538 [Sphingomonadales bacterium]|nr:hypothetical protein [Sphingomonadales bacterium]